MQIPDFVVPRLNTSSALGQALISMFRAIEMELTLEGASPGAVQVIVFGGCAVHLYTHHRVSTDVDAEIYCANTQDTLRLRTLLAEFPEQFFDEQSGRVMELNYDLQYNTSFGPLHEDYWERSLPLEEFPLESALHLHVAAPIDIAISKLGRATDQDVDDIMVLLRAGFIVTAELRQLALQAIDMYVGNKEPPRSILTNILHDYLETADGEAL
ncbi:hypothetical protein CER19_03485 [Pseudomonas sp. GL93]|uniref:DUF6036 family nucleotidyltransferase n=1 Tax=Pseudomonas sp. GL93 TaxID=2014741 RepID=UPI000E312B38|nr:DUF6036 family nucleotidyltransferase [Pseudomonas sp. GL93]RFD33273.1 hypothetical protein CER19_03485 [Pseudomonas sp. GL93]